MWYIFLNFGIFLFKIKFIFIFLDCFDVFMSKINFFYFNVFLSKNTLNCHRYHNFKYTQNVIMIVF